MDYKRLVFTAHAVERYADRSGEKDLNKARRTLKSLAKKAVIAGCTKDGCQKLGLPDGAYLVVNNEGVVLTTYWKGKCGNKVVRRPTLSGPDVEYVVGKLSKG